MVRVPERLYHHLLIHFYQPRYDYAVCTHLKLYPKSSGLSREVYPISCVSHLFRNISMIMRLFPATQSAAKKIEKLDQGFSNSGGNTSVRLGRRRRPSVVIHVCVSVAGADAPATDTQTCRKELF